MSISLPNGTLLAAPSSSTIQYTAAVTRILHLANFSAELKTRDLQAMFREYENEKGGFRIKWLDDVNALVVFADAATTKRAYLYFLLHPPSHFHGQIRPYDKPDAAQIIQSLAARTLGHRGSSSNASTSGYQLVNGGNGGGEIAHNRTMSSSSSGFGNFSTGTGGITKRSSISSGQSGPPNAAARHTRTSSASSARAPMNGVLNFNSTSIGRLPTHRESHPIQSTSSSDNEPTITMDPPGLGSTMHGGASFGNWKMGSGSQRTTGGGGRRESVSADKAMREVEKALANASVEIQG